MGVFDFPALCQDNARFVGLEPGGIAIVFLWNARLKDFHQKSFYDVLLHAARLPKNALRVNINMEVARLNDSESTRFFFGFTFGSLTMR